MSPISPVKLQALESSLGSYLAIRYCAPLAFYMLLRAAGYLDPKLLPDTFCKNLDRDQLTTASADWSRPALTKLLREQYGAPIVSWQLKGGADIEIMKQVGYLKTDQEASFFLSHVYGRSVEELVRAGYPVIVTMKPGFGNQENHNIHAVVIAKWFDKEVVVFDPDARNADTHFEPDRVREFISENGAGSFVLPEHS
jgi:hypothetical protein